MALFTSNNPDKLIAAAETNLNRLQTELAESKVTVERYKTTATKLAVEGTDIEGRERAQKAMRAAQDSADTAAAAISMVETQLAGHLAARDAAIEKAARRETATEIENKLRESGDISRECDAFFKRLSDFADWAQPLAPEAAGLQNYCAASRAQIPEAIALIQKLVANHGAAVMAGTLPAKLKRLHSAPFVEKAAPTPITITVFSSRSFKWTNPLNGRLIVVQRFCDTQLPPAFAKAALDAKVAVRLDDPLCKQRNTVAGHAEPLHAFSLDDFMAEKAAGPKLVEPIKRSDPAFVETIGQPKRVSIVS